jgi:hypothetical protein
MNIFQKSRIAVSAAIALGLTAAAGPATAGVLAVQRNNTNFSFTSGTPTLLPDATFNVNAGDTIAVTFSSECATDAPAGNFSAWTDVDIQLVNSVDAVVNTLSPTSGSLDAFCSANGTAGFDGFSMNAVTATHTFASSGFFKIRVIGRLDAGATGAWYGDKSLVVWK